MSIGNAHSVMSTYDKLIRLLMNTSILTAEQRAELMRIRLLSKSASGTSKNKSFINNCYTQYYEKNIQLDQ
jgi:hypothetical protein